VHGINRSFRDRRKFAIEAAIYMKSKWPNHLIQIRDGRAHRDFAGGQVGPRRSRILRTGHYFAPVTEPFTAEGAGLVLGKCESELKLQDNAQLMALAVQ
jgi:hypothetical protein